MKPCALDRIRLRGLRMRCIIGVQPWERQILQEVTIGLTLLLNTQPAGVSDHLGETVDYKQLTKQLIAMVEGSSFQLVEAMAERIAALALDFSGKIAEVRVRVDKPGALRFARTVGVVIRRQRD